MQSGRFLRLVPLLLLASLPGFAQIVNECSIVGEVRIPRKGAPEKRIQVTLETRGAVMGTTYTDDRGSFEFTNLQGNLYHVVINDEDYAPVNIAVAANPFSRRVSVVHVDLIPRAQAGNSEPARLGANAHMMDETEGTRKRDAAISGGNPFMVNQANFAKQFPPKARKEFDAGVKSDRKGHPDDAIAHYKKALAIAPAFYPARNNLGTAYLNKGDLASAEAEFSEVAQNNSNDAAAFFNLGNVFLLTKRYDVAAKTIQEGLRKQPNSALGTFLLGSVYSRVQQPQAAEKTLRRALELDPALSKAHLALVNLYLQEHRTTDAAGELKSFLRTSPKDPFAPKAREVLHKLETQSAQGQAH